MAHGSKPYHFYCTYEYTYTHKLFIFVMLKECAIGHILHSDAKNETTIVFRLVFLQKIKFLNKNWNPLKQRLTFNLDLYN